MNRETPVRRQGVPSRPEVTAFGNVDTDKQVGRRVLGRLLEDYSDRRSLVNRRNWLQVFHPRRLSRRTFGRWSIFPSRRDRSARRHAGPLRRLTNVRFPPKHPSVSPSGTPAYCHTDTQRLGCDTSYPGGRGPLIPIHRSDG